MTDNSTRIDNPKAEPTPSRKRLIARIVRKALDDDTNSKINAFAALALMHHGWPAHPLEQLQLAERFVPVLEVIAPVFSELAADLKERELNAAYLTNLPNEQDRVALIMLAFTLMVGKPFNYSTQNDGKLVMELRPVAGSGSNTNASANEFKIHTDDAAVELYARVNWIVLAGIINPPGTLTGYASAQDALAALPERFVQVLRQPRFQTQFPISFNLGEDAWSEPMAVVSGDSNQLEVRFPSYATRPVDPLDEEAKFAIDLFTQTLNNNVEEFPLNPGTMLVFNNIRGAHRRGAILNGDRLVLRTYAARTLELLKQRTGEDGPIFSVRPFVPVQHG